MSQTAAPLVLTAEDRAELARWSQGELPWLAERARIVLACAEPGSGVARVAAELGSTRMTVRKWRRRFAEEGLAGLADHDRPGRPVAQLVLTGAEDPLAPPDQVAAFEAEMRAAKVADWQVVSYGNTLHGFTNPAADGSMMRTAMYHAQSDRRSWAAMKALFDEVL